MSDVRWALMRPNEDGHSLRVLAEAELRDLLANPRQWRVREFLGSEMLGTDPNYWPDGSGLLVRVEVVVPVQGGYRLPEDGPYAAEMSGQRVKTGTGAINLGDVVG